MINHPDEGGETYFCSVILPHTSISHPVILGDCMVLLQQDKAVSAYLVVKTTANFATQCFTLGLAGAGKKYKYSLAKVQS